MIDQSHWINVSPCVSTSSGHAEQTATVRSCVGQEDAAKSRAKPDWSPNKTFCEKIGEKRNVNRDNTWPTSISAQYFDVFRLSDNQNVTLVMVVCRCKNRCLRPETMTVSHLDIRLELDSFGPPWFELRRIWEYIMVKQLYLFLRRTNALCNLSSPPTTSAARPNYINCPAPNQRPQQPRCMPEKSTPPTCRKLCLSLATGLSEHNLARWRYIRQIPLTFVKSRSFTSVTFCTSRGSSAVSRSTLKGRRKYAIVFARLHRSVEGIAQTTAVAA